MLYGKYAKMHVKTAMQYRSNMIMLAVSSCLISVGELLSIMVMFKAFNSVGNWGFYEATLMFGIVTASYSFTECFARGFDEFPNLIKHGDLDRIMVRPANIIYQIFGTKIELWKLLKTLMGVVVSIIALINLNIVWTFSKVLVLISTFACGCIVVWGVMLIGAGICVFTVENLEFINIFTNGAKEVAYYPINIYSKWLSRIFTFIIPVACFNYLPISYLLGYGSLPQIVYALSPFIGILFVVPCIIFFLWCIKKYQGTGT